jgi:hypothetical protein
LRNIGPIKKTFWYSINIEKTIFKCLQL